LLRLPANEPGSPSTVLPSKITHLVPPQVQDRITWIIHLPDTLPEFPSIQAPPLVDLHVTTSASSLFSSIQNIS
ncbi:hypothetical protein ILYODFUR_012036, partial [Ilyodon furcidens]